MELETLQTRLRTLVSIPSQTGDADKEFEAASLCAQWMREMGADHVTCDRVAMKTLREDSSFPGIEVERDSVCFAGGVVNGTTPGPSVMLMGHIDVVPVGDLTLWKRDPYGGTVEDGKMYGRGTADMKGGVVSAFSVFEYFAKNRDFSGQLKLVVVSGEEDGGSGCLAAVRAGWHADVCIIPEPTVYGDSKESDDVLPTIPSLVLAHAGSLTLQIDIEGRSSHASTRLLGESALDHLQKVMEALRVSEKVINDRETNSFINSIGPLPYATSIGKIHGGEWASSVMDRVTLHVRCGAALGESVKDAIQRVKDAVAEYCKDDPWLTQHPPTVQSVGGEFAASSLDPNHVVAQAVREAHQTEYAKPVVCRATPYGCDMRILMHEAGTATCVYGPGEIAQAHVADEYISLEAMQRTSQVLRNAVQMIFQSEHKPGQLRLEGFHP